MFAAFLRLGNRIDGRFFATHRMTCFAITMVETLSPHLRRNCHPEEAAMPTKDLLLHGIGDERLAFGTN